MSEANKDKLSGKTTVREIFETATQFEHVAHSFYAGLVGKVSKNMRYLVEELAEEELGHVRIFTELAENPEVEKVMAEVIARPVSDTQFSDCVMTPNLGDTPDDQAVLQYAIMREDAAMKQYTELAETAPEGPLKAAFKVLAIEETKHKAELETIYNELVDSRSV